METELAPPVEVRGLRKHYRRAVAVDEVSFTVRPGRIVGLLGPNGAGKTTTMRILLGLASADAGDALICGRPIAELPRPASIVGAVLDGGGLDGARTGRQHLRIAAAQAGAGADRVDALLAEVELGAAADRRIGGYSLGMRQRLALAAALIADPSLLVLDEPANGLDPEAMHWLRGRLRAFADAGGAILLSSHLLADVAQIADDVVVIVGGRVAADVTLADATAAGDLERFYLQLVQGGAVVR
ncbi:ABC transporter ATP-binding protein [Homoserinibacter sp. YIM 151385]|uniref:ABC transporter ATP-binding protein n=1 Tax=Homoserinibacter sp. YIM 151385 TaxID=2985506 RepID=UPI0022F0D0A3|nr:ATP-binding cassette domain-containing protein [Homoserinibacter sp. YIM 151385]WBU37106.1 ATP-binding cassette domain-containing protein [Homoserinibacter sp. YIM 151385]